VRKDARKEAAHFVAYADLRGRHLLPVLDLEHAGGLGVRSLTRWTRTWLREVARRVGVRGMIYTTPHFWRTAMANTRWFAEHGYRALWIAHWETDRPDVPARNWDRTGWTFWQYASCGSVAGVSGCVDLDRYRHRSLRRVTIRRNR
jgi:lysozyme